MRTSSFVGIYHAGVRRQSEKCAKSPCDSSLAGHKVNMSSSQAVHCSNGRVGGNCATSQGIWVIQKKEAATAAERKKEDPMRKQILVFAVLLGVCMLAAGPVQAQSSFKINIPFAFVAGGGGPSPGGWLVSAPPNRGAPGRCPPRGGRKGAGRGF